MHPYEKIEYGEDVWYQGYQVVSDYNKEKQEWNYQQDETVTQENFVNRVYEEFIKEKEEQKKEKEEDRIYAFHFFKDLPNQFDEVIGLGIIDGNKNGWSCSPRYTMRVIVDLHVSQERVDELFDEIDNVVWEANKKGKMKTYDHQFSFYDIFDTMKDIKMCDYKYAKQTKEKKLKLS